MNARYNRRRFLQSAAAIAVAAGGTQAWGAPAILSETSPNSKLNIAGIGVGGRGGAHVESSLDENLVAVCDAVDGTVNGCLGRVEKHNKDHQLNRPLPKSFYDYRQMFDKMHKDIDAVFVATPDHQHAPASMMAIKLGKHVYCEKPLTLHDRRGSPAGDGGAGAESGHADGQPGPSGRGLAAALRNDLGRRHWQRPASARLDGPAGHPGQVLVAARQRAARRLRSCPAGLHWDEWLGPAPERPYLDTYRDGKFQGKPVYQPFVWRGWWDFGTGALGDIGCHAISGTFSALKIEFASAVELIQRQRRHDRRNVPQLLDDPLGNSRPRRHASVRIVLVRRRILSAA